MGVPSLMWPVEPLFNSFAKSQCGVCCCFGLGCFADWRRFPTLQLIFIACFSAPDAGAECASPPARVPQSLPSLCFLPLEPTLACLHPIPLIPGRYCMHHLPGYAGTSAVLAVTLLDELLAQQAQQAQDVQQAQQARQAQQGLRLVGTLAHEVMMVTEQLLGCYEDLNSCGSSSGGGTSSTERMVALAQDGGGAAAAGASRGGNQAGGGSGSGSADAGGPAQICALLSHLLLLAAGGGLAQATALCDTFGAAAVPLLRLLCCL